MPPSSLISKRGRRYFLLLHSTDFEASHNGTNTHPSSRQHSNESHPFVNVSVIVTGHPQVPHQYSHVVLCKLVVTYSKPYLTWRHFRIIFQQQTSEQLPTFISSRPVPWITWDSRHSFSISPAKPSTNLWLLGVLTSKAIFGLTSSFFNQIKSSSKIWSSHRPSFLHFFTSATVNYLGLAALSPYHSNTTWEILEQGVSFRDVFLA